MRESVLLLVLGCMMIVGYGYEQSGNVLSLTPDDIDTALGEFDNILIKFYAPWCGHCKSLAPTFSTTADSLFSSGSKYRLAQVDCDIHTDTCQKYSIRGYPTMLLFSKGRQPIKYSGSRDQESIVSWLNENALDDDVKEEKEDLSNL